MMHLPAIPFLPAWLNRRPKSGPVEQPSPWPANPRTYDDDLKQSLANEALLAAQLTKARQLLDVSESARLLREAEKELQETSAELMTARAEVKQLRNEVESMRLQRDAATKQLDGFLYDDAALAALDNGTGQPIRKG